MELVYTDSGLTKQGVLRDFALDMAYGDDENDFLLTMPLPQSKRYGADRDAVITEYEGDGSITIEQANGSTLHGLTVNGKAERKVSRNLLKTLDMFLVNVNAGTATDNGDGSFTLTATGADCYTQRARIGADSITSAYEQSLAIPVTQGNTYTFSFKTKNGVSTPRGNVYWGWWDASYARISYAPAKRTYSASETYTFVAPAGASYLTLRVGIIDAGMALTFYDIQLEEGAYTEYEPYFEPYVEVVQGRNLLETWKTSASNGITFETNADGTVRAHGSTTTSTTRATSVFDTTLDAGTYTISGCPSGGGTSSFYFQLYDFTASASVATDYGNGATFTIPDRRNVRFTIGVYGQQNFDKVFKPQLERGSVATPYVPYGALEFVTRRKNLLPRGNASNKFVNNTGGTTSAANGLFAWDVVKVQPNAEYVYSYDGINGTGAYIRVNQFKADGTFIKRATKATGASGSWSFTTDAEAAYIIDNTDVSGSAAGYAEYLQLEQGTTATPYEPYQAAQTDIPLQGNVLASLPDGTRDEETVDEAGHVQLVKRVGVVDLGTLSYTKSASIDNSFFCSIPDAKTFKPWVVANAICSEYKVTRYDDLATYEPRISARTNDNAGYQIRDSRYSEVAEFASAMSGVMLYYELAEPQTIDLGFIDMPATYDGYTRLTIEASTPPTFRIRYEVSPATRSYLVEIVPELEIGALVYAHGTDIGGIVDTKGFDNTGDVPVMTYSGRTWHGIMDASITRPDAGKDYLTLTGDINAAIGTLITRAGLGAVFSAAPSAGYTVSYQVPRYVSMWEALRRLCKQYGMRPQIERGNGKTVLGAVARQDYSNGSVSDLSMGLQFERMHRPVNHLVVLGQGELAARTVIDLYADIDGNVSTTQTLFGSDEVAAVYENTSDGDASKLLNDGIEKLKEYQTFANVDMSLPSNEDFQIGDTVTAYSVEAGLVAAAEVVKKVVTVGDNGFAVTSYELGEPAVKAYR